MFSLLEANPREGLSKPTGAMARDIQKKSRTVRLFTLYVRCNLPAGIIAEGDLPAMAGEAGRETAGGRDAKVPRVFIDDFEEMTYAASK